MKSNCDPAAGKRRQSPGKRGCGRRHGRAGARRHYGVVALSNPRHTSRNPALIMLDFVACRRQAAQAALANGAADADLTMEAPAAGEAGLDYQMLFQRGREVFDSMQAKGELEGRAAWIETSTASSEGVWAGLPDSGPAETSWECRQCQSVLLPVMTTC